VEAGGSVDQTRDWTARVDLSLHVQAAVHNTKLGYGVLGVVGDRCTRAVRAACVALVLGGALLHLGLIVVAGFMRDALVHSVLMQLIHISAAAITSIGAVESVLNT